MKKLIIAAAASVAALTITAAPVHADTSKCGVPVLHTVSVDTFTATFKGTLGGCAATYLPYVQQYASQVAHYKALAAWSHHGYTTVLIQYLG